MLCFGKKKKCKPTHEDVYEIVIPIGKVTETLTHLKGMVSELKEKVEKIEELIDKSQDLEQVKEGLEKLKIDVVKVESIDSGDKKEMIISFTTDVEETQRRASLKIVKYHEIFEISPK